MGKRPPQTGITVVERLRVERGLSYEHLAELAGLNADTVRRYARGLVDRPRVLTLRRLAGALEQDVWDLLREYEADLLRYEGGAA